MTDYGEKAEIANRTAEKRATSPVGDREGKQVRVEGFQMVAFDEEGRPLELTVCNTICPAARVEEGREIALRHMREVEAAIDDRIEEMLSIGLIPAGATGEATHYLCTRTVYREQVTMEVTTLRLHHAAGKAWCAEREMLLTDDPEEIKEKFCCVTGETEELLRRLGLVRKFSAN